MADGAAQKSRVLQAWASGKMLPLPESSCADSQIEGAFTPLDTDAMVTASVNAFTEAVGEVHVRDAANTATVHKADVLEMEVLVADARCRAEARSQEARAEVCHVETQSVAKASEHCRGELSSATAISSTSAHLAGIVHGLRSQLEIAQSEVRDAHRLSRDNEQLQTEFQESLELRRHRVARPESSPTEPLVFQDGCAVIGACDDIVVTSLRQELEALHSQSQDLNSEMQDALQASEAVQRQNSSLEVELASLHRDTRHVGRDELCAANSPEQKRDQRSLPLASPGAWLAGQDQIHEPLLPIKRVVDFSLATMTGLPEHARAVQSEPRPDIIQVIESYTRLLQQANQEWSQVQAEHSKAGSETRPLGEILQNHSLSSEAACVEMNAQNLSSRLRGLHIGVTV